MKKLIIILISILPVALFAQTTYNIRGPINQVYKTGATNDTSLFLLTGDSATWKTTKAKVKVNKPLHAPNVFINNDSVATRAYVRSKIGVETDPVWVLAEPNVVTRQELGDTATALRNLIDSIVPVEPPAGGQWTTTGIGIRYGDSLSVHNDGTLHQYSGGNEVVKSTANGFEYVTVDTAGREANWLPPKNWIKNEIAARSTSLVDDIFDFSTNKYTYYPDSTGTGAKGGWYLAWQYPSGTTTATMNGNIKAKSITAVNSGGYDSGGALSGYVIGHSGTALTLSESGTTSEDVTHPLVTIYRALSGSHNLTNDIISISDGPTTTGTVSGKVLTAKIGSGGIERISLNPRCKNADSTAYVLDTHRLLDSDDTLLILKNYGNRKVVIDYNGYIYNPVAHAAIYRITDIAITADQNVWYKVTGFTTKYNDGLTITGDSIQLTKAGSYEINVTMSLSGLGNAIWEFGVFKAGALEQPSQLRYAGTYDVGTVIVTVESDGDDWVSFKVRNTTDGDDPTIKRFSANIKAIHLN